MTCVICKHGTVAPGHKTMTLERGDTLVVVRQVPAAICNQCGEAYTDGRTTVALAALLDAAEKNHESLVVRTYAA